VRYSCPEKAAPRARAYQRALAALAREHPARYEALLAALLAAHPGLYPQAARGRVLGDLRREYPERFAALYAEEKPRAAAEPAEEPVYVRPVLPWRPGRRSV
jgi:hypothetical protein